MKTNHRLLQAIVPSLLAALALIGGSCAGSRTARTANLPPGAIVTTEYEKVYLTGSHIPVLVPKSPTARMDPTISPLVILNREEAVRVGFPMR